MWSLKEKGVFDIDYNIFIYIFIFLNITLMENFRLHKRANFYALISSQMFCKVKCFAKSNENFTSLMANQEWEIE